MRFTTIHQYTPLRQGDQKGGIESFHGLMTADLGEGLEIIGAGVLNVSM